MTKYFIKAFPSRGCVFSIGVRKLRIIIKNEENGMNPRIWLDRRTHHAISSPYRTWVARRSQARRIESFAACMGVPFLTEFARQDGALRARWRRDGTEAVSPPAAPIGLDQVVRLSRTQDAIGIVEPRLHRPPAPGP
ncbi:MAG TPA: hypothetical protein DDZ51_23600 [Planctomycetaceae bacterium]|nr:hypothetical protein [Planctomycetaceae bacterium]